VGFEQYGGGACDIVAFTVFTTATEPEIVSVLVEGCAGAAPFFFVDHPRALLFI
jgi:hypothetical protein